MKLAEAYVEIKGDMSPLRRTLRSGGAAYNMVSGAASRLGRAFSRAFSNVLHRGLRLAKWGLIGLVGAVTGAIYSFAKFEEQMNMVATMLDEQGMRLLPEFRDALQKMAVQYGESTATLSKGLYDILSASIPAEKAIKVLDVAVRAARAGMTDAAVATDALTTLLNVYGLEAEEAERVADILFATVKRGKLTFAELAQNIGMVASTAKMANVDMEELGAILALMTRAGIQTSEATTALNGILRAFLKPTSDGAKKAREFGLELSSNTIRTKGLYGAMRLIRKATAEEVATMFPRIRGMKGVAAAIQNLDAFTTDLAFTQDASGRMMEAYEKTARGTHFEISQLREQVTQTARKLAENLAPEVNAVVTGLREWIGANEELIKVKFGEWVDVFSNFLKAIPGWWQRTGKRQFSEIIQGIRKFIQAAEGLMIQLNIIKPGIEEAQLRAELEEWRKPRFRGGLIQEKQRKRALTVERRLGEIQRRREETPIGPWAHETVGVVGAGAGGITGGLASAQAMGLLEDQREILKRIESNTAGYAR